jgi:hypothetical protein
VRTSVFAHARDALALRAVRTATMSLDDAHTDDDNTSRAHRHSNAAAGAGVGGGNEFDVAVGTHAADVAQVESDVSEATLVSVRRVLLDALCGARWLLRTTQSTATIDTFVRTLVDAAARTATAIDAWCAPMLARAIALRTAADARAAATNTHMLSDDDGARSFVPATFRTREAALPAAVMQVRVLCATYTCFDALSTVARACTGTQRALGVRTTVGMCCACAQ